MGLAPSEDRDPKRIARGQSTGNALGFGSFIQRHLIESLIESFA